MELGEYAFDNGDTTMPVSGGKARVCGSAVLKGDGIGHGVAGGGFGFLRPRHGDLGFRSWQHFIWICHHRPKFGREL